MAFSDIQTGRNPGKQAAQILSAQELGVLNEKSNLKGFLQCLAHLAVMLGRAMCGR
jgi:hypothetical protein